jgi:hypothetical protein
MSIRVMSAVWELHLPPSEKLVLLALADWSDDQGRCWPSIAQVSAKSGVSGRTVQRMLREAEKSGLIKRTEINGKGCEYRLTPRHSVTPDKVSPVTNDAKTPDMVSPNTSVTTKGSEAKASSPRAKFPPPPNVSPDQWRAFQGQRKKRLNERSYLLLCNKLIRLAEDGWPPGDMIDLAIERGWETVFKPRDHHGPPNQPSLRGTRPDPALDLYRAAVAAEQRENRSPDRGVGPSLPAIGSN